MRLSDGAIDAVSQPKIISIDNEAPHAKSLAGVRTAGLRTVILCLESVSLTALSDVAYTH